jgi:dCTP deaminase
MILSANEIDERLDGKGDPDQRLVIAPRPNKAVLREKSSASVDLHLGCWFLTARTSNATHFDLFEQEKPELQMVRQAYTPLGKQFIIHPHEFVLAATLEWIRIPKKLSGYVTGKSSWGRRGLVIETAPGVHPRFTGCIALELTNVGEIPITLVPGTPICQLFLHMVTGDPPDVPAGKFACRRQPVLGRIDLGPLVEKLRPKPGNSQRK